MASSDEIVPPPRPSRRGLTPYIETESLSITFAFRCNLACSFCMVESGMGQWTGVPIERFEAFCRDPAQTEGLRRVILSGGEVTLDPALPSYVALARSIPSVEHVRIQTNGIRLGTRGYLQQLVDAGVDEFFVSIHGHDAASCDKITRKRGSFAKIVAGLTAVAARDDVSLITDTAICTHNVEHLADIVGLVAPFSPESMEFWSLWPQIDKRDERGLLVPIGVAAPRVIEAVRACVASDIVPVVRNFPRCMLGPWAAYHHDLLPPTFIDAAYWEEAPVYDCIYRGVCSSGTRSAPGVIPQVRTTLPDRRQATDCLGLAGPYVDKFGWEEHTLKPFLKPGAVASHGRPSTDFRHLHHARQSGEADRSPPPQAVAAAKQRVAVALAGVTALGELGLVEVGHDKRGVVVKLDAGATQPRIWLLPAEEGRAAYARVGGEDLVYERGADDIGPAFIAALEALIDRLGGRG
jgi:pyruvate-formate lyase-activating enzyme